MNAVFKKWILRLLKISGIVAGGFVLLALLLTTFYAGEMKQLIVGELNKSLKSPVKVEDIQFSILRHFPYASVELNRVTAMDAPAEGEKKVLIQAESISLLFHLAGLLSKDVSIKKVVMKNGQLFVRIDKDGHDNYHIWKTSADSTGDPVIDLQKILLDHVDIQYEDLYAGQMYRMNVHDASLKGRFASEDFTLDVNSTLLVQEMRIDKINYLRNKEIKVNTRLAVNYRQGLYRFGESNLQVADLHFTVKGDVVDDHGHQGLFTDLAVETNDGNLEEFISMLPEEYRSWFDRYDSRGNFTMNLSLKGGGSKNKMRDVSIRFTLRDGRLAPQNASVALTDMNLEGTYRNHTGKGDVLDIPALSASLNGHPIRGDLRVTNLIDPFVSLHARAGLNLKDLRPFISHDTIEAMDGKLNVDIAFAGKVKDLSNTSAIPYKVSASGSMQLENASMKLRNNPLDFNTINGTFNLLDNNLEINSLTGNISSTDFVVSGMLRNFVNYLFIPGQFASIDGRISSKHVNLDELIVNKNEISSGDTSYLLKFNPRLVCNFDVMVGQMHFRKFKASGISGTIRLKNQVISSDDLAFQAMGGHAQMNAVINAAGRDKVTMALDANISGIDIREMFYEMENFDQQTMTDKNLRGQLTASVKFSSDWSTDLTIRPATAKAQCSLQIDNGELNGFTPILALSKYLKVADLNNIRFSTLKNEINIADRKIYIPAMEIKSSALNLTASGVHDFDNIVDYKLKMLLSDVLGKKVKQQHSEFGDIEDDGLGRSQLFLTMKGPVDNPRFAYDKKSVGEKIKNDIYADKNNVKQMLKEDFGFFKKDTTRVEPKKKKEELQVDWDGSN